MSHDPNWTPLFQAVFDADVGKCKKLLDASASVNVHDASGMTPLMYAASMSQEIVELLLDHGSDVNARSNRGETALMFSSSESVACGLIDSGADMMALDNLGRTAIALLRRRGESVKVLAEMHLLADDKRFSPPRPVTALVVGAGNRGSVYAAFALQFPHRLNIVGVADPIEACRAAIARDHGISPDMCFSDWREVASRPQKVADCVMICTQDRDHEEPAVAFARLGYHMLLEKPIAPEPDACKHVHQAIISESGVMCAVAHVLRYSAYTHLVKLLLSRGMVGDVVSVQRLEPVGLFHFAHSFVRGNWRRSDTSPLLLAKSCHDLDWIRMIMGTKCTAISSFGSLSHFTSKNKPSGAADRCLDCPSDIESVCPSSAETGYLRWGNTGWPVSVLTPGETPTPESITHALRTTRYGQCAYSCDNDVVDNQVVAMEFGPGRSANFTVTAFTPMTDRRDRIFGTHGMIEGDGRDVKLFQFGDDPMGVGPVGLDPWDSVDEEARKYGKSSGHGGADFFFVRAFVAAVGRGDPSFILSGMDESLETHMMVFAAEKARRDRSVETL